ncbi:hypothetical protein [Amycolatopsis sp. PS_44_ISF1]|uniref:hypothetical protein n=1 Tax=Amycolatopsis sp. PS_44_ISF1 TaxID=2974917 RepID=UPI0028E04EB0|nr:hypothetical protein [Amycolatopsis sp. PS_44_ISF1]MDT8915557.1 hypothetical protein [Amycolatopsis sp. PS_44_ISF1]
MSDRDAAEPELMSPSESLDEDDLGIDPVEAGIDPPEHWSAADHYGTTAAEVREGETHEQRLAEEQPDVQPMPIPARPIAATPAEDLDGSIDDVPADVEDLVPGDFSPAQHTDADPGAQPDITGGDVAEAIREVR